ncbi:hypothetical protein [Streptomonospora wellingtoniae]|uniref:DUF1707 domain-containing protein n=1 Tax=Streptomonospora wellingtoniae TaxID=3075544 RepID=A0ABU2L0B5_9ACTN|nr:hypothetical protein [Streptomonospora sp. DSM 45055]MDT0304965.1 hypothetical protein [Streptomonospora sp. DSM 45055]
MADRDPREELRERLDSGELSPTEADRALAALDREGDRAALRAAERPGTMSAEESARVVDAWGIDEAIDDMMRRLGVESASR